MKSRLRLIVLLLIACVAFPERSPAPVIFKPKEGTKYHPPGEEEINGNAKERFEKGQAAEKAGNFGRAMKAYQSLGKRYPRDVLAPDAVYRTAQLEEQVGNYIRAAGDYRYLVEHYPQSPHFDEAIEAQFRIGEMYLSGKKIKFFGVPIKTSMDRAVEIFAAVVRSAPFGPYTARAQFDIGLAREKQGLNDAAVAAYQSVVDKFPNSPIGADAQYQIGYIWFQAARAGTKDTKAVAAAKTAFQDFLFRYPHSEKVAQARENLRLLERKETADAFGIAKFYDKQRNYRAAVIYYNDVLRQQPGSPESEKAKQRIDELRAKVGDAALQPREVTEATAQKKPAPAQRRVAEEPQGETPAMRASPDDVAPLPPPGYDVSLPPPASLTPDTTTAPEISPTPSPTPSLPPGDGLPDPAPSATPEATESPAQ